MPISWQLIFFGGLTIGFYWNTIIEWWNKRTMHFRTVVVSTTVSVAISTILINVVLSQYSLFPSGIAEYLQTIHQNLIPFFNKEQLTLPRLLLFLVWIGFGYWIVHRLQAFIVRWFGWILIPFGSNSLYVYILHAFLVFFAHLLLQGQTPHFIFSFFGSLAILGLILLAIRTKFLMKIIPR